MLTVHGPPSGPRALLLPGTASTAEFVARAFGPALAAAGFGLVSGELTPGADDDGALAELDRAVARFRPALVGGVSRGAHLAVRWADSAPQHAPEGLMLAMPAWTGPPGPVAAASAAAAQEVERVGVAAAVAAVRRRTASWPHAAWVVEELASAWPRHSAAELTASLRATSHSSGPTIGELAAVAVPCGVVALTDDPLHPAAVARDWAATIPGAKLVETDLAAVGRDRRTLGRGAVLAWLRARFAAAR